MKALRILLALTILCLAITSASAYTITEFCADGYAKGDGDEYFILEGTGNLSAWSVTDGEGTVSFSGGSGRTVVARSAELYYQIHGSYPDFEITESLTSIPNAIVSGRFQLANAEDSLTLLENGRAVQTVAWPADVAKGNGRVHRFTDGGWDKRVFKIGQSDFAPQTFTAERVTLFVSPDCSHAVITDVIRDADESILLSMYEFTSVSLAEALADAEHRGVEVTILMEGGPVGGISDSEKGVLNYLSRNGAEIFTIESEGNLPARYRYLHTKYLVADGEVTVVLSENFKDSGIPESGYGNRGWGAAVEDSGVAEYFADVFADDLAGYDIYRWAEGSEPLPETPQAEKAVTIFKPVTVGNVQVTPVISPDTSFLVGNALDSAQHSVDIQQAYIAHYPDSENPWLAAALRAAEAGAEVRIQLDGMYYNTDSEADNDEIAASVNRRGLENLQAKILTDREGILKLHNKGFIIDDETVLISSINWNYNSPTNNREAGLLLESEEAAAYYTRVFSYDWDGVVLDNQASAAVGFDIRYLLAGIIIVGLVGLYVWRRRH
ncbi:MAG: phospholipase [Methanocorpusculum sp.]|nr:phospholipase [Methanocorpusculum sp.]